MASKVLIIGGGLSGLALGQCLRKVGIDFEIFERDADEQSRGQGWALSLRECLAGIYKMFSEDMPPLEESVSVFKDLEASSNDLAGLLSRGQKVAFGGVHYSSGEQLAEIVASGKEDLKHHWFRANRAEFRTWLSHGLKVNWGKQFVRYEETADKVTVFFADGSSAEGSLLIAADGAHSRCRAQLMGAQASQVGHATLGAITANIIIDRAEYRDLLKKGAGFLTATSPIYHFFLGPCIFSKSSETAEYYWSVTWDDKASSKMQSCSKDTDGQASLDLALNLCKDLHPSLRRYIETTTPDQIVTAGPQLLTWAPETDHLPGKRVTLMGDALHTMPPFRGAGGNTAITDALEIAQLLIQARDKGRDVADIIEPYERVAVPRGRVTMQYSKSASLNADPTHWAHTMQKVYGAGYEWKELGQVL